MPETTRREIIAKIETAKRKARQIARKMLATRIDLRVAQVKLQTELYSLAKLEADANPECEAKQFAMRLAFYDLQTAEERLVSARADLQMEDEDPNVISQATEEICDECGNTYNGIVFTEFGTQLCTECHQNQCTDAGEV